MKITGVRAIPLGGATHDTGWPGGTDPGEQSPPLRLDPDGLLPVPTGPGLGISLDPDALAKYGR